MGENASGAAERLSVGIPTYNHATYLEATIESLLAQRVPPREIVVCDNHSTDRTAEILARYEGRVRVVRPPEHLPMMANWNHLLGELEGEWAALLSSDDLALPNYVESLAAGIEGSPGAVLVRGAVELIDAEGTVMRERAIGSSVVAPPRNFVARLASPKVDFGAAAWRRDAWEAVGGFPDDFRLAGDWAYWLRLCPHGAFVTRGEPIARYRRGHRSEAEESSRVLLWAEDYRRIYTEVVPAVAEQLGGIRASVIRHARTMRCHNWLTRLSRKVSLEERAALAEGLAAWARDCDVEELLARFRRERVLTRPRFRTVRRWAARLGIG